MIIDPLGRIHSGEIWLKSQCKTKEEQLVQSIYACLQQHNYQNVNVLSHTRSVWQRGSQKIVVSVVDDIWDCAENRSAETPYLFDSNTKIITDNFLNCPSVYQLLPLPASFYGIYSYTPDNTQWMPERDYTFAVNRQDYKRMEILLELYQNLGFNAGHVNFNCRSAGHRGFEPEEERRQEFLNLAEMHASTQKIHNAFVELAKIVPIKNHSIDHDTAFLRSWVSVIVETYSSDNVISVSEKIFRALVTPAPWVAYAGRYTVARLRALGFDVLDDIVDHRHDRLLEAQYKKQEFVIAAKNTIAHLKTQDLQTTTARCWAAAQHNQALLSKLAAAWEQEQHTWLEKLSQEIQ